MYVLLAMWRILLTIPMATLWMLLYAFVMLGWGVDKGDKFIMCWNQFVEDADFQLPVGEKKDGE